MLAVVRLDAKDLGPARTELNRLAREASNPAGGLRLIGAALLNVQNERFRSQSDPQGRAWAKLRPLTVLLRGGATGPILRRSGQLMESGNYKVSGATVRVGIAGVQAAAQQFGATIVPKKGTRLAIPIPAARGGRNKAGVVFARKVVIPPRPMVGFGPRDEAATRRAVAQWLRADGQK